MSVSGSTVCSLSKDGFTWCEKLIARASVGGAVCAATVAIYLDSKWFALGYLALVAAGTAVVIYDTLCVYCPYPFKYSDCLFFPYQLLASVAKPREGGIPAARNVVTMAAFGMIFAAPQYWLWGNWVLIAIFWTLTLPLAALIPLYLCRRCRHQRCPLNRAG